jgi:hypothetical protein
MANPAPGVNITVNAPSSNPQTNAPTGTWFVTGVAHGPSGVAVPINSISDFNTYFGKTVNSVVTGRYNDTTNAVDSSTLYDALDVYFREGGITAYVSRAVPTGGSPVSALKKIDSSSGAWLTATAQGPGVWGNNISVIFTLISSGVYTLTVTYNGNTMATSPVLNSASDAVSWAASLPAYQVLVSFVAGSGTIPAATTTFNLATGAEGTTLNAASYTTALGFFTTALGYGQVSAPGNVTSAVHKGLLDHAQANSRVALLDAPNTSALNSASGTNGLLTGDGSVANIQTVGANAATDSSYGGYFAPWVIVPGITSTTPNTTAPVFQRTVAPSAIAAANIAATDVKNDCNVPAAGILNGSANYAIDVAQTFSATDRASLNNGGVNLIRNVNGQTAIYGFRSTSTDPTWAFLNNVRFRMQILRDFDVISESFVFAEIDGRGQIFSTLGGALSGQCQNYWLRKSIYGANAEDAYTVNVGPQVNTPATIAAGQVNAQVNLRMAPFGEFVNIQVTKYLVSVPLPVYN